MFGELLSSDILWRHWPPTIRVRILVATWGCNTHIKEKFEMIVVEKGVMNMLVVHRNFAWNNILLLLMVVSNFFVTSL